MDLESPRLRLRRWRPEDRPTFAAINAELGVRRYLLPPTREGSDAMLDRIDAHFARHGWGFWALEERESSALSGLCGLAHIPWEAFFTPALEIGWRLSSSLSDLTVWRNFRLRKCNNLEDNFDYSLKSAWLFQFLARFSLSPTGC